MLQHRDRPPCASCPRSIGGLLSAKGGSAFGGGLRGHFIINLSKNRIVDKLSILCYADLLFLLSLPDLKMGCRPQNRATKGAADGRRKNHGYFVWRSQ